MKLFGVCVLLFCFASVSSARLGGDDTTPVHLDVYFEVYCPDSIKFVLKQLYPAWEKFKDTGVMTLTLYPYGKAYVSLCFDAAVLVV